jgi:gas vesicle protein
MSANDYGPFSTIKAFVMGAIAGAGVALLFAPLTGEEARKKITEKGDDTWKNVKDQSDQVMKKGHTMMDDGKKAVDSLKGEMGKVVDEGKKSMESIREEISKFVDESKETMKKTVKEEMAALENELAGKKKSSGKRGKKS